MVCLALHMVCSLVASLAHKGFFIYGVQNYNIIHKNCIKKCTFRKLPPPIS